MNRAEAFRLEAKMKETEGVIIHKPSNMYYLSGYTGEGIAVIGSRFQAIVTDFRYTEQVSRQAPGWECCMIEKGVSHEKLANDLFDRCGITTVYYEDDAVTVRSFERIRKDMPGKEFKALSGVPETMRKVKDVSEIESIEQACSISCKAFDDILSFVRPGMTEKQVQLHLDFKMLELGADGLAFSTISAAGENGSLPHAIPSDRVIGAGEMLTLDFGAKKNGYCADMTRTFSFGKPSPEMKKIYDTVLEAQCTCQEMLRPGVICRDVDAKAREIIDNAGYAGRFGHGLGHGVGIDIHETPSLNARCDEPLQPGHVVTVEPGIYVPGLGGVRIENTCVITQDGARTLVTAPKELIIL